MAGQNYDPYRWPLDLFTSDNTDTRRFRVDPAQTSFFEGREFRTFEELSIPQGQSLYIEFTSLVNFVLFNQLLSVDSGACRFRAYAGATPTGSYSTPLPVVGKNRMSTRPTPFYESAVTIASGGGITGGTVVESFRVAAANATAQQQTVMGFGQSERGLPAGVYYLQLENIGNGTVTGDYAIAWEERP